MAKNSIPDYSATAASNTDIQSVNIDEGCAPSGINNAIRELMVDLKNMDTGAVALTSPQMTSIDINGGTIDGVTLGTNSAVTEAQVDNININGNAIISTNLNGNIALTPNGTGEVDISKVDIDSGAIDGTTIGASSAAAITGTTITGTSFVSTGNMTFGDNDKAIFGAGSDLQIYHDGSNSYVKDAGTGNLIIAATNFAIQDAAGTENIIVATTNGSADLYYDGSKKLATTSGGVDVTGTVTADGVEVDGLLHIDGSDNSNIAEFALTRTDRSWSINNETALRIYSSAGDTTSPSDKRLELNSNGDISFYDDTGVTQGFFWDASAESLGIGTTSPSRTVAIVNDASQTELSIVSSTSGLAILTMGDTAADNQGQIAYRNSSDSLEFYSNGSQAMQIDSSGNLLVGTSNTSWTTDEGLRYFNGSSLIVTRDSDEPLNLNRTTNDGDIAVFRKDGTSVGSIGVSGSDNLYIAGGTGSTKGIIFNDVGALPATTGGAASDASIDIGQNNFRWKDLYLSGRLTNDGTGGVSVDAGGDVEIIQEGTGRLKAVGGIFLGGTVSANLLDDYETGTFTARITDDSGNVSATTASKQDYVKIGKLVYIMVEFTNVDTTGLTAGDRFEIDGLPFNHAQAGVSAPVTLHNVTFSDYATGYSIGSSDAFGVIKNTSGSSRAFATVSNITSGSNIINFTAVYEAA